jgi:CHAD domain-containing protein
LAFELQRDEPLHEAIRRIATERLALAVEELKGGGDADATVHNVRKRLKELRSVLRLVRRGMNRRTFDRDNRTLRNLGRPLSALRDATVMVETVAALAGRHRGAVPSLALVRLREALTNRRDEIYRQFVGDGRHFANLAGKFGQMQNRIDRWGDAVDGWETLSAGLHRAYRRGQNAMTVARHSDDVEDWHEWRKRAKDLRYQLEIIRPMDPKVMELLATQAKDLSDLLGEDHDLAVLHHLMEETYGALLPPGRCTAIVKLIAAGRAMRERKALNIGSRVYAAKPDRFLKSMDTCWVRWRQSPMILAAKEKKAQGLQSLGLGG